MLQGTEVQETEVAAKAERRPRPGGEPTAHAQREFDARTTELDRVDPLHDRMIRGVHYVLTALAERADDPAVAAKCLVDALLFLSNHHSPDSRPALFHPNRRSPRSIRPSALGQGRMACGFSSVLRA